MNSSQSLDNNMCTVSERYCAVLCCCGQSILRYRSDLLRTLGTLLFLPAFLTGAAEQKQVLEVELFSDFTDNPVSPAYIDVR